MTLSRHAFVRLAAAFVAVQAGGLLAGCGGGSSAAAPAPGPSPASPSPTPASPPPPPPGSPPPPPPATKSAKRGIACNLASRGDVAVLSPGVSWWYDWGLGADPGAPTDALSRYDMGYVPMVWGGRFDDNQVLAWLKAHPEVEHLLAFNEPNLVGQANLTPQQAATLWPRLEAITSQAGVQLVGPAITWGTMPGYQDPVAWLDAFHAAYRAANGGRDPWIDAIAFHWYDYGLANQLDRLKKYGKPFWVTEMANWHNGDGSAQIDSAARQQAQMTDMVATCEGRADVQRYAWFTGRWSPDPHFTSLLGADGALTALGTAYLGLPF